MKFTAPNIYDSSLYLLYSISHLFLISSLLLLLFLFSAVQRGGMLHLSPLTSLSISLSLHSFCLHLSFLGYIRALITVTNLQAKTMTLMTQDHSIQLLGHYLGMKERAKKWERVGEVLTGVKIGECRRGIRSSFDPWRLASGNH